jgi:hypothetical protein
MANKAPRMLISIVLVVVGFACSAATAFGSAQDVIRDCSEDGVLNHKYSHSELTKALDKLPSDLDEYTDCRAVIRSAQLAGRRHAGGAGAAAATPPNPSEQKKIDAAARSGGPVNVGGKALRPGASGAAFKTAGLGTDLPPLVLAVLIATAAAMVAGTALAVQRHRPALVRAGGPLVEPLRKLAAKVRDGVSRFRR